MTDQQWPSTTTGPALGAGDLAPRIDPPTALEAVNPAVRLVVAVVLTLPLVVTLDWVSASTCLALELLALVACGVRPATLVRRLAPLALVAPLSGLSMLLYGEVGGRVYLRWGPMVVSHTSCLLALAMFLRIFALAVPATLVLNTDATRMADGLAQVLRLPSRFVLGSLAGLRTIGLFTQDWRTIGQARRARGLGDQGRFRRWALTSFSLLVLAVRRGTRLATAMEAKGFGQDRPRSWARPSRTSGADVAAVVLAVLVDLAAIGLAAHLGQLKTVFS